jgi:hypothetical protein
MYAICGINREEVRVKQTPSIEVVYLALPSKIP